MTFWTKIKLAAGALVAAVVVTSVAPIVLGAYPAPFQPGLDILPAARRVEWTLAGVPGGIPTDRKNLIDVTKDPYNADKTGATDAQPAIMKAIADAKDKDVVYLPAGTYRINNVIGTAGKQITIRGAGPDKTILMAYNPCYSVVDLSLSGGADYLWSWPNGGLVVTDSPSRGETVLKFADTKPLSDATVGAICQISLKNDPKLPVVVPANWDRQRRQTCRITAVTPTTITVFPPLSYDLPASLEPRLAVAARHAEWAGLEDLTIDGSNSGTPAGLVGMGQTYACWIKNVHAIKAPNYNMTVGSCVQCEVRHCFIAKRKAEGSNGAGLLVGVASATLFVDNIIGEQFPSIEVNAGCTGNVFAYNYCYNSDIGGLIGCSINTNHGAHNSFNLYEGNVAPKFQSDGYHGSASDDTAFRNWFHGTDVNANLFGICVYLNRFTRNYNIVGNVLGHKGYTWLYDSADNGFGYDQRYIYVFGLPNMGNGGFNGQTVQPGKGKNWPDWDKMVNSAQGKGPGPGGFQEIDLDVKATTLLKGNYNYKDNAVPESESLKDAKLPNSLFLREKPEWFGNLNWPPFGPDTDFEANKIPAQVRYEEMTKAPKN